MKSKKPVNRNIVGLLTHAQEKARTTRLRVSKAIDQMLERGEAINFNAVANAASVTKNYLYTQAEIRERIEGLRRQQGQARLQIVSGGVREKPRTDKSKDILLQAKERRIAELEVEVTRLREELKVARGKQYEAL
jgi:hypothetical protein